MFALGLTMPRYSAAAQGRDGGTSSPYITCYGSKCAGRQGRICSVMLGESGHVKVWEEAGDERYRGLKG